MLFLKNVKNPSKILSLESSPDKSPLNMFDIIRSVKRIAGLGKKPDVEAAVNTAPEEHPLGTKLDKLSGFFDQIFDRLLTEYHSIKEKSQDLSATNYVLGMQHLEDGNLKEAIFRFKITRKFWPKNYDAYYQLIICLILNRDFEEAQKVIDELLEKSPNYKEKIDQILGNSQASLNPEKPSQITNNANNDL